MTTGRRASRRASVSVVALATLGACAVAWAEVQVQKTVLVPDYGAEQLYVVNRLGRVVVSGWDRPEIQVRALKRAADARLAEQLRVQVSRRASATLSVVTFARVQAVLGPEARGRIHALLFAQHRLLASLLHGESTPDALVQLSSIDHELTTLRLRGWREPLEVAELSVPVARGSVDLEISAPRQLVVSARTLAHDVEVRGCHAGATLSTESGSVLVRDARGEIKTFAPRGAQRLIGIHGPVVVEGGSEGLELRRIRGGVRAVLSSGSISARDIGGAFADLRTIEGQIRLRGPLPARSSIQLVSVDGDLFLELPTGEPLEIDGEAAAWHFGRFRPVPQRRAAARGGRERARAGEANEPAPSGRIHAKLGPRAAGRGSTKVEAVTRQGQVHLVALDSEERREAGDGQEEGKPWPPSNASKPSNP